MKAAAFCGLLCAAVAAAAFPKLTPDERVRALTGLMSGEKAVVDSLAGLTDAQWNFRPGSGSPSIAEYADLIATNEDSLFEAILTLAHSPFVPGKGARPQDDLVLKAVRERNLTAPDLPARGDRHRDKAAVVAHFKQSRRRTLDFVRDTEDDLRLRFRPHPVYGTLDAYQWVLVLSAQTDRLTEQLNEVKLAPGYPR